MELSLLANKALEEENKISKLYSIIEDDAPNYLLFDILKFFDTDDMSIIAIRIQEQTYNAISCYEYLTKEGISLYENALSIYAKSSDNSDEEFLGFKDIFTNILRDKGFTREEIERILGF